MRWTLLAAFAVLFVAPGQAQVTIDAIRAPSELLVPGVDVGDMEVDLTIECSHFWDSPLIPGDPRVEFRFEHSEFLAVSGDVAVLPRDGDCVGPTGEAQRTAAFTVGIDRQAPGLTPLPGRITAVALATQAFAEGEDSVDYAVTANYVPILGVDVEGDTIARAEGSLAQWRIHIQNLGNAPTTVRVELLARDGDLQITLPDPVHLDVPKGSEPSEQVVKIRANVQGGQVMEKESTFAIRIIGASTQQPDLDTYEADVEFLVRSGDPIQSVAGAVLAILLVVAAGFGGFFLTRRLRRRLGPPDLSS